MFKSTKVRTAVLASVGLATLGTLSVVASPSSDSTPERAAGPERSKPSQVPAATAEILSVLRDRGVDSDVPAAVRQLASDSTPRRIYAPNEQLTRSIPAPAGAAPGRWYLIPGDDSVCLHVGEASSCATTDEIETGLLAVFAVDDMPPAPPIVDGRPVPSQHAAGSREPARMRVLGVAPDGVDEIRAGSAAGSIKALVRNNAYAISGRGLRDLEFVRSDGTTQPIGPR